MPRREAFGTIFMQTIFSSKGYDNSYVIEI